MKYLLVLPALWACAARLCGQPVPPARVLTLSEAVRLARLDSPDARSARHAFRSAYWNYRYHRANYLPSLTLTSSPTLDRAINKVTQNDGSVQFLEQNLLNTDLTLKINQNVALTGGAVFVESSLRRLDRLDRGEASWNADPVSIGISQSVFGYNALKWDRRIEPVRYREARQTYLETLELVAERAVERFFALAMAQSNYEMALRNYAHADSLARFGKGRYEIGRISENEMLQLELNRLSEETNRMNARIEMENSMESLRSYLGLLTDEPLRVRVAARLPAFTVDVGRALAQAALNHPDMLYFTRRRLEARSEVAQAKASAGLKADLYMRFGLTQTADRLGEAFRRPLNRQYVSVGINLPILDWGRGKGRVRVARSNRELVETQIGQSRADFDMNVRKIVGRFNLQLRRVRLAARADTMALRRSEVARGLYLSGKGSLLDLNAAVTAKNDARGDYLRSLHTYWSLYYSLRSLTLFDFESSRPIEADFEALTD